MASKPAIEPELHLAIETAASAVLKKVLADRALAPPFIRYAHGEGNRPVPRISRATLHRLAAAGVLLPKRFGRKVVYDRADLDAYIQREGPADGKKPRAKSSSSSSSLSRPRLL